MLPLILLEAGANTIRNREQVRQILANDEDMRKAGVQEADRMSVAESLQAGNVEEAQAKFQEAWVRRSPELAAEMGNESEAERIRSERVIQDADRAGMTVDAPTA